MAIILKCAVLFMTFIAIVNCDGETELKIEVTHKPETDCTRKSKRLDLVTMHYTGYLENGSKFDSR